jgi:hypothetical protein
MNLKPQLLTTLTNLGITEAELPILSDRMLSLVSSLEAQIDALNAQIATLTAQRDAVRKELVAALVTASKLVDSAAPEPGETEPVAAIS